MDAVLTTAIAEKRLIAFVYHNDYRIVEPHSYGRDKKGSDVLCGWQRKGRFADAPDWRLYAVAEMKSLEMLRDSFDGARLGYKRGDRRMTTIHAQL